ncbi:MAG: hypothetical protein M1296_06050 [Chloroflexi bacterium]|nr:hypothetical protein [Chloroflexota bacterium]
MIVQEKINGDGTHRRVPWPRELQPSLMAPELLPIAAQEPFLFEGRARQGREGSGDKRTDKPLL